MIRTMVGRVRTPLGLLVAAASVACSEITFEGGGPLTLTLTPDRTSVASGGSITFDYDARGSILVGVILDYGDGSKTDSTDLLGSQSAGGRFVHAFGTPGTYEVIGTLLDNIQGAATDTVSVTVTGGG